MQSNIFFTTRNLQMMCVNFYKGVESEGPEWSPTNWFDIYDLK